MRRVHIPRNVTVKPPTLVAHRGYALRYPENTMPALRAAIEAKAGYIEFDVQMTADGVPVLLHDTDLWRTGRLDKNIYDMTIEQVMQVEVNEDTRLGGRFTDVHIPILSDIVELLQEHPEVTAFVELKRASLVRAGVEHMVDRVLDELKPVLSQCVVVSFDPTALEHARAVHKMPIGWALFEWSDATHAGAEGLQPEYLFCNYTLIPDDAELWKGPWRWVLYEVVDPELALSMAAFGAEFVETMAIKEMLYDRRLIPHGT